MEKKLFAVKVEPREKDAMEHVARVTGATLSSLHLGALRTRAHRNLGYVLLHSVHGDRVGSEEIGLFVRDEREAFRQSTPRVLLNLTEQMSRKGNAVRLTELLPLLVYGSGDGTGEGLLGAVDARSLTRRVGEAYLSRGGPLDRPDPSMVLDIASRELLECGYRRYARGSLEELSEAWESASGGLGEFRRDLVAGYLREYRPQPAHLLSIAGGKKDRAGSAGRPRTTGKPVKAGVSRASRARGKGGKGMKRPRRDGDPDDDEVEVVEVSPVVEVDELDE